MFNFLTEFLATTALIAGALLIVERGSQIYPSASGLWGPNEGIYLGLYIFIFVLAWGGPTGTACNLARDTAPRLAHWLLPIPNKGVVCNVQCAVSSQRDDVHRTLGVVLCANPILCVAGRWSSRRGYVHAHQFAQCKQRAGADHCCVIGRNTVWHGMLLARVTNCATTIIQ